MQNRDIMPTKGYPKPPYNPHEELGNTENLGNGEVGPIPPTYPLVTTKPQLDPSGGLMLDQKPTTTS